MLPFVIQSEEYDFRITRLNPDAGGSLAGKKEKCQSIFQIKISSLLEQ
jgi:hypothetical protein